MYNIEDSMYRSRRAAEFSLLFYHLSREREREVESHHLSPPPPPSQLQDSDIKLFVAGRVLYNQL